MANGSKSSVSLVVSSSVTPGSLKTEMQYGQILIVLKLQKNLIKGKLVICPLTLLPVYQNHVIGTLLISKRRNLEKNWEMMWKVLFINLLKMTLSK
jgi:hypothetical protein